MQMDDERPTIDDYARIQKQTPGSYLIDVRTPQEFARGHLPGARNVELARITTLPTIVPDKSAKLFLYCRSGRRSGIATEYMRSLGYGNVTSMGGIKDWHGPIER